MTPRITFRGARLVACLVGLSACSGDTTPTASSATTDEPAGPSADVLARVCASPCAGPMARVVVYRDANKTVGRLRFDGDLQSCSHPPRIYFDPAGKETLTIPERPVTGPEDAAAFARQRASQHEGLTAAETLRCPR